MTMTDEQLEASIRASAALIGVEDLDDVHIEGPNDTWLTVGRRQDGTIVIRTVGTTFAIDSSTHEKIPNTRDHKKPGSGIKGQTTIVLAPRLWG